MKSGLAACVDTRDEVIDFQLWTPKHCLSVGA